MRRLVCITALLAACGGDDSAPVVDGGTEPDASACPREPAAADRERLVVVSHPYTASGAQANTYRVMTLADDGALADTGTTFELGRSLIGEIAFTPDGEVAIVAQDDGTLGVVRFDGATPVVVHAAFAGSFYAARVVMDPRGDRAYVLDDQWRENGGGVYRVSIGCDGTLTDDGLWFAAKLPAGLHLRGELAVLASNDVGRSPAGSDAHLLDWTADPPAPVDSDDVFGDDEAIVSGSAITTDGAFALIGDSSSFSGVPNRVAIAEIAEGMLSGTQVITPIEDPLAIVPSPFDDVVLVVSGFGDAVFVLDRTGATFTNRGELTYVGASPQLPGGAVLIDRGALEGLVLIAENVGVRRIRMSGAGTVTDLGVTTLGAGTGAITGSIGVQP